MAGLCQNCTMCCEILEVNELNKSFGEKCKHIGKTDAGPGCLEYKNKPASCFSYVCLYLDSQRRDEVPSFPEELRPDVCKVVMGNPFTKDRETLYIYPHMDFQDAWYKNPHVNNYLKQIILRGAKVVVVLNNNKRVVIRGDMMVVGEEHEFKQFLTPETEGVANHVV